MAHHLSQLPADLPVPADDGAADHLPGAAVPALDHVWYSVFPPGRHAAQVLHWLRTVV